MSIYSNICVDAIGAACHPRGLLGTDLHAVGCGGFVETLVLTTKALQEDLVLTTIALPEEPLKLKTKCFEKSPCIRFDLENLKDPKIVEVFQATIGGKFAAHRIDSDVERSATLNSRKGPWDREEDDATLGHKRSSESVREETALETTGVYKH